MKNRLSLLFQLVSLVMCVPAFGQTDYPVFTWGSTDVRYEQHESLYVPKILQSPDLRAWRGERVSAQAVFSAPKDGELTLSVSDLTSGKNVIQSDCIRRYFVRYVMADGYGKLHKDSCIVADRLDPQPTCHVEANTTCPVWLDIRVPRDAAPGKYRGTVSVSFGGTTLSLPVRLTVANRVLPEPKDWKFHLDLWQNPYSVARYFNVPLWSKEHFERMRPIMERYAEAGGKVITASIIQHPWNSQTYDPFESMIVKMKSIDGTWTYDYTVFDRWVEFMMSLPIRRRPPAVRAGEKARSVWG